MSAASTEPPPPAQGYVRLEGAQARLALAGNLFRIAVREITRSDGSKATVFRDIDYPVRQVAEEPANKGETKSPGETGDAEEEEGESSPTPNGKPTPRFGAWVILGPEYEDPPPAGASPSPNRLRRAGPSLVVYEFDAYAETEGKDDEYLRIELDFSGTHPVIRDGIWRMEAEAGYWEMSTEPGCDFTCIQGAYGLAFGRFLTPNLHVGVPDTLEVSLVRAPSDDFGSVDDHDINPREGEGTGTYTLKRVPADPADR